MFMQEPSADVNKSMAADAHPLSPSFGRTPAHGTPLAASDTFEPHTLHMEILSTLQATKPRWWTPVTGHALSIRTALGMLAIACILPISVGAVLLFVSYYERQREQLTNTAIDRARGVVFAVDREFAATQSALIALGTSHRLATGDLAGFHKRAVEVLSSLRADSILVLDTSGQIVLSTHLPYGEPLPKVKNPLLLQRILATGKPAVSDLFVGPISNPRIFN